MNNLLLFRPVTFRTVKNFGVTELYRNWLILLVGAGRFEHPTPCAQGRFRTWLKNACFQQFSFQWFARAALNRVDMDGIRGIGILNLIYNWE